MSVESERQRKAFEFLLKKYHSQERFTQEEFQTSTGWTVRSFKTYLSKQFRDLLLPVDGAYRIHGVFGRYAKWPQFRDHVVSQRRKLARAYEPLSFGSVIIFEFFMPLRNEEYLRTALDALFFKDSVLTRLKAVDERILHQNFPKRSTETADRYFARLCAWVGEKFVGYSIQHVSGRFRAGELRTQEEIARAQAANPERYLVDETTAVVRFIIPCGTAATGQFKPAEQISDQLQLEGRQERNQQVLGDEAARIRWFFATLFVERVIEVVAGEDEIWLLESGMINQLHIWKAKE